MNNPFFSILIANYNNGKFFADCYKSIIAQTYRNWEVIIVDDKSTDDSVEIIKEITTGDSRFKFFENDKNLGCGYTKRRCAELASGEICGFVDPDDAIAENALQIMVEKHAENPDAALVYSNFIYCDENLSPNEKFISEQVENNDKDFYNFGGKITAFSAFKKAFYDKTSGIDAYLQKAVDQDLYLKLYDAGKVVFLPQHLYLYRIHSGGISVGNNQEKAALWHWRVIFDTAKRRGSNIDELFTKHYIRRIHYRNLENKLRKVKQSRLINLLQKFGFLKNLDL